MPGESRAEERAAAHRVAAQARCPLPAPEGSAGEAQVGLGRFRGVLQRSWENSDAGNFKG